jgi:hypothetical protein
MSKNLYRTANGKTVDIDNLRLLNEDAIAVGNMNVNARGDIIGSDGSVIMTRNEFMKKRYNTGTTVIKETDYVPAPIVRTVTPVVDNTPPVTVPTNTGPVDLVDDLESLRLKEVVSFRGNLASSLAANTTVDSTIGVVEAAAIKQKLKRI